MIADDALFEYEKKSDTKAGPTVLRTDAEIANCVREKMMGIAYLKRANEDSQKVLTSIRDQYTFGMDVYTDTLHEAYELLETHSSTTKLKRRDDGHGGRSSGLFQCRDGY